MAILQKPVSVQDHKCISAQVHKRTSAEVFSYALTHLCSCALISFRSFFLLLLCSCALVTSAFAADDLNSAFDDQEAAVEATAAQATRGAKSKSLVFKMMVVNPSDKFKQTYSMKSYLPEEVEPRHIISKEDLEVGYDAEKRSYYTAKEIELDPGASVVKSIEIEDVWRILEAEINDNATEAREVYGKLKDSKFEAKARLLLSNVEVLLTQVFERQNDATVTPEEHISIFRENKKKLRDVELDLVALRRLLANAGGDAGLFGKAQDSVLMTTTWDKEAADKAKGGGSIPAWVAWRVIFGILIFVGVVSLGFYLMWQWQLKKSESRNTGKKKEEAINLDEILGGSASLAGESKSSVADETLETPVSPGGGLKSGISKSIRHHVPPPVPDLPSEQARPDDQAA